MQVRKVRTVNLNLLFFSLIGVIKEQLR